MLKTEARKLAKAQTALMTDKQKELASGAIVDALSGFSPFKNCRSVFIFKSLADEPDTQDAVALALRHKKQVSVPKMIGDGMRAAIVDENTIYVKNRFGIEEPAECLYADDIDLAVIPLVGFCGLFRLGHGGGYYDKFLEGKKNVFKLGIAFESCGVPAFDVEPHDVPLDALITEKRIVVKGCETQPNAYYFSDENG